MGTVFSDPHEREQRICSTVASEGTGVAMLLERIFILEKQRRLDGRLQKRRQRSLGLETLDWALELVKTDLENTLKAISLESTEPRQAAEQLLNIYKKTI
jgi:putative protein kinase ArgK-like GTPase of G3E family